MARLKKRAGHLPVLAIALTLAISSVSLSSSWADNGFTEGAREVGRGFKKMGQETGQAVKDGGREVGEGFFKIGKATGEQAGKTGRSVGQWFKAAGKKTGEAFKQAGRSIQDFFTGD